MFHFPALPHPALCVQAGATGNYACRVSPFGDPRITVWLPTPRGLSQAPTSFIGSWCQGIHRALLKTWLTFCRCTTRPHLTVRRFFQEEDARVHCAVLKIRTALGPSSPRVLAITVAGTRCLAVLRFPECNARLPAPRGLSQAPTSFIGSWCQDIHRMLLETWLLLRCKPP